MIITCIGATDGYPVHVYTDGYPVYDLWMVIPYIGNMDGSDSQVDALVTNLSLCNDTQSDSPS